MDCIVHVAQRLRHYWVTFTFSLFSQFHIFIKLLKFCKFCFVLRNLYEYKLRRSFSIMTGSKRMPRLIHHPDFISICYVLCRLKCPTFYYSMDCSLPGSSVHRILWARILEWVAMPSSRGSSWPRDWNHVSYVTCTGRWVLYHWHHLRNPFVPMGSNKMWSLQAAPEGVLLSFQPLATQHRVW